jgi:hypothetical protein
MHFQVKNTFKSNHNHTPNKLLTLFINIFKSYPVIIYPQSEWLKLHLLTLKGII